MCARKQSNNISGVLFEINFCSWGVKSVIAFIEYLPVYSNNCEFCSSVNVL